MVCDCGRTTPNKKCDVCKMLKIDIAKQLYAKENEFDNMRDSYNELEAKHERMANCHDACHELNDQLEKDNKELIETNKKLRASIDDFKREGNKLMRNADLLMKMDTDNTIRINMLKDEIEQLKFDKDLLKAENKTLKNGQKRRAQKEKKLAKKLEEPPPAYTV